MLYIYSHSPSSSGAKLLAEVLDISRIKHTRSRFRGKANKTVINWGSSELPAEVLRCRVLNPPDKIAIATNKLEYFKLLKEEGVRIPKFTTSRQIAAEWIEEGHTVVVRKILNGSGGRGIILVNNANELPDAPLYTQYVNKKYEYRVHCSRDEGVFDWQEKAKRHDADNANFKIRNLENGFIFKRDGVVLPEDVKKQSLLAFAASGLNFGAVDIIYNEQQEKAYVLEINTAPGLEGTTLQKYAEIFS